MIVLAYLPLYTTGHFVARVEVYICYVYDGFIIVRRHKNGHLTYRRQSMEISTELLQVPILHSGQRPLVDSLNIEDTRILKSVPKRFK